MFEAFVAYTHTSISLGWFLFIVSLLGFRITVATQSLDLPMSMLPERFDLNVSGTIPWAGVSEWKELAEHQHSYLCFLTADSM